MTIISGIISGLPDRSPVNEDEIISKLIVFKLQADGVNAIYSRTGMNGFDENAWLDQTRAIDQTSYEDRIKARLVCEPEKRTIYLNLRDGMVYFIAA